MAGRQNIVAISGATGFIGKHLTDYFQTSGYKVLPITRNLLQVSAKEQLKEVLSQAKIVINLAGASLFHLWTERYKKELYDSRILTTRHIVECINGLSVKPEIFISASAVGYYPSEGCYDEDNQINGSGFLSELCRDWEREAYKVSDEVRLIIIRFGIVLSPEGGAYPKMALPAKWGISPVLGTGEQAFSWIDLKDLIKAFGFIVENDSVKDTVNLTAPYHLTNRDFMKAIGKHYHKTSVVVRIPESVMRFGLRETSQFLLEGQCAIPTKLINSGFVFASPNIYRFLESLN